jgi:hypothetical protein
VRARLHGFVGGLREHGIAVSVAESLDAMQAVGVVGVDRERLREALAATLVKDERDRGVFDDVFERHFPLPPPAEVGRRRRQSPKTTAASASGRGRGGGREGGERHHAAVSAPASLPAVATVRRRATPRESERRRPTELRRRPVRELTAGEIAELRGLLAALSEQLKRRLARRWRAARRGTLDLRRTLRAATATAGVPLRLSRRRRRPVMPDLLALCDVSGSVAAASELLLALLAPASRFFRRVHLYVYVDRLCPVTIEHGRMVPDGPLDLHGRSDLGRVLVDLWAAHPRLSSNTLVLVLGDARNNRRPPRADLVRRLRERVQRLDWIVPEPRARWNTGDSALAAYARSCDTVYECVDLDGLVRAVRQVIG